MKRKFGESVVDPHRFPLGELDCSTHTISQLLDEVRALLADKSLRPRTILCINAHIYNLAWSDTELRQAINEARIIPADGMAIVAVARLFGERVPERCNMTEAFRAFLQADRMPDSTGVLVGTTEEEGRLAAGKIEHMSSHCRIVKAISGYLDDAEYERALAAHRNVDFLFIGMGTPRTVQISRLAGAICPEAIVWGIGGGTIKILAGAMREAPAVLRRSGLQWLYRLWCEPARLWRRYLIGNPLFIYRILTVAGKTRRIPR